MRPIAAIVLALALVPCILGQGDEIKLKPKWMPKEIVRPPEIDKVQAKELAKAFTRAWKAIKSDDIDAQLEALERYPQGRHPEMVKPLSPALAKGEHPVRRAAAWTLATLGCEKAIPLLKKAMRSQKNRKEGDIMDAIGTAIGCCANPKKSLYKTYSKGFDNAPKEEKRAVVLMFGHAKEEKALPLLAQWLGAPAPENPDSPSNPPASYWKARYAEWNFVKQRVSWAIWNITGELLESEEDVEEWIAEKKKRGRRR